MKKWEQPEINALGVNQTKDEDLNENAKIFFPCQYCGERFWTKHQRDEHQKTCPSNPANPPASGGTGPEALPTPALS